MEVHVRYIILLLSYTHPLNAPAKKAPLIWMITNITMKPHPRPKRMNPYILQGKVDIHTL